MASKDYYICPICRHKNEDTKKYCDNCGTWLLSETFSAIKYQRKSGSALRTIGKVIGYSLVVLVLLIGALVYFSSKGEYAPAQITSAPQETEAEYKASAREIDFETLARNPEKLKGQRVKFSGKVTAIVERGKNVALTLAVTEKEFFWDDFIFIYYTRLPDADRILEDDIITVWGEVRGLDEGRNALGETVSVPSVNARYIELISPKNLQAAE